jgi:MFS family permease
MDLALSTKMLKISHWKVAFATFITQSLSIGLFSIYGLFSASAAVDLSFDNSVFASGVSILIITQSLLGLLLGRFIDAWNIARLMCIGALCAGCAFFTLSYAQMPTLVGLSFIVGVAGLCLYGTLPMSVLINRVYKKDRGAALAIAAAGTSFAGITLPLLIGPLIEIVGWRVALRTLACATVVITCLVVSFLVPANRASSKKIISGGMNGIGQFRPIFRDRNFWIIGITFSTLVAIFSFYAFVIPPHALQARMTISEVGVVLAFGAAVALVAKLLFVGFLDRLQQHIVGLVMLLLACQAAGWVCLIISQSMALFLFGAALFSVSAGPFLAIWPFLNGIYFDQSVQGKVNGYQSFMVLPLALIGPPLAGFSFDQVGSYQPSLLVIVCILLSFIPLFSVLRKNKLSAAEI